MKNFILAATACSSIIFSNAAWAQQAQPQGVYQTYLGDRLLVTESYRITSKPDGSITTEAEITPAAAMTTGVRRR